jgi:phage recombination protein Bet
MTGTDVVVHRGGGGGTLAVRDDQHTWLPEQRAALVQIGLEKAPEPDLAVFLHYCQRTRLDPFSRQIYMIARRDFDETTQEWVDKWTMQTGIDGFRIMAQRTGLYRGPGPTFWCGADGVWRDVWLSNDAPMAAKVSVRRADFPEPVEAIAHFREYVALKRNGNPTRMWQQRPAGQLAKCAEALAIRRAFPQDMAGLYTDDEMEHLANPARPDMGDVIDGTVVDDDDRPAAPNWDARIIDAERHPDGLVSALEALRVLLEQARAVAPNDLAVHQKITAAARGVRDRIATEANAATAPPAGSGGEGGEQPGPRRGGAAGAAANRPGAPPKLATKPQTGMIAALLAKAGLTGDTTRLIAACRIAQVSPVVGSLSLLTTRQASSVIEALKEWEGEAEGALAERATALLPDDGDPMWEQADAARHEYEAAQRERERGGADEGGR